MGIAKVLFLTITLSLFSSCHPKNSPDGNIIGGNSQGIIGGEAAAINEFPFIVNIWLNSPRDSFVNHLCGGSLIHKKWVLTAAHCVLEDTSEETQDILKPNKVRLFMGSNEISGQGGRELKAKSIVVHPKFSWPKHDLALIELTEEVTDVTPVLLNQKDLNSSLTPLSATVAGWGLTDQQGKIDGEFLQKVTVPLITRQACAEDSYPQKKGWTIESDMICASSTNDTKSACAGDSGGPLVQLIGGHYTQIGVVSWGAACRGVYAKSKVEGYADVSDAFEWIQGVVK